MTFADWELGQLHKIYADWDITYEHGVFTAVREGFPTRSDQSAQNLRTMLSGDHDRAQVAENRSYQTPRI